ncbi:MAG: retroviral-like aspartic protease family protein [Pseudomonadota bacterium]
MSLLRTGLWLMAFCAAAPAAALDLPLKQSGGGGFYLDRPEQLPDAFLVDTGSAYLSLTERSFRALKAQTQVSLVRHVRGVMADGRRRVVPIYSVSSLTLAPQCQLKDVEVAVLAGGDRNILGVSGLKRMQPFTLAMEPAVLTTAGCH